MRERPGCWWAARSSLGGEMSRESMRSGSPVRSGIVKRLSFLSIVIQYNYM